MKNVSTYLDLIEDRCLSEKSDTDVYPSIYHLEIIKEIQTSKWMCYNTVDPYRNCRLLCGMKDYLCEFNSYIIVEYFTVQILYDINIYRFIVIFVYWLLRMNTVFFFYK